ncbi:hypothetical protein LUZ60_016601 [Juncus effusus]|nr:hypothetical protein LUZ60_016601 [Juncus effusus]
MASLLSSPPPIYCGRSFQVNNTIRSNSSTVFGRERRIRGVNRRVNGEIRACPFEDQPIIKDALKEPVAFLGGVFAGLLRLDLNEDPLKEWISKTVEASGITEEIETGDYGSEQNGEGDTPQQILIE